MMPLTCEEGGSGPSRSATPTGVIIQLADWTAPTGTRHPAMACPSASAGRDQQREYEREVATGPHA
jgi:hypothetical protein